MRLVNGLSAAAIKAVSFDVTGTLVVHKNAVAQTYAECAERARLRDAPTAEELKPAFRRAYREALRTQPYFGFAEDRGQREWWRHAVRLTLSYAGRELDDEEFERYFRLVYQHYGSPDAYVALPEVRSCLQELAARGLVLGVTSNTPTRTVETTLPMLGLAAYFSWFACSGELGAEKPERRMYDASLERARFWVRDAAARRLRPGDDQETGLREGDLRPENVLHVGDNMAVDYCGARAAGFQALFLDRTAIGGTTNFQDWVVAPDYPGKCEADIEAHTINDLSAILDLLVPLDADDDDKDASV